MVYNGPRTGVVPFFKSMGFRCPERKAVPDFLQEVNSIKDQAVRRSQGLTWAVWFAVTSSQVCSVFTKSLCDWDCTYDYMK